MSGTKKLLIVIGSICLVLVAGISLVIIGGEVYRFFHPYLDREVSGPVTITMDWVEITPKKPLRAERQIQYLTLDMAEAFTPDYKLGGMRFADGAIAIPEVELIDQSGRTYSLNHSGMNEKGIVFFMPDLPKDRLYSVVRIRSDKPIKVSRIYWRCYNQWDVS